MVPVEILVPAPWPLASRADIDHHVPYSESVDFTARCSSVKVELRLLKDGDHRMNLHKSEIARAACGFFADRMP